ncbi:hypothetical protein ACLOJK_017686 [Asimina triloba]
MERSQEPVLAGSHGRLPKEKGAPYYGAPVVYSDNVQAHTFCMLQQCTRFGAPSAAYLFLICGSCIVCWILDDLVLDGLAFRRQEQRQIYDFGRQDPLQIYGLPFRRREQRQIYDDDILSS